MGISLKAMRYFCSALEHGSISAAAREQRVAASAVAAAIDQIEAHFQLTLTIRARARGIEATTDGTVMAHRFRALLDEYDMVLRDGAARSRTLGGELRVGYYAPVAPAFLPRVLADLMRPEHAVTVYLEACDNDAAQDGLRHGAFDAILFVADGAEPWVAFTPLIEAPPYCLVAADHPLAGRASVALRDLAEMPLVSLSRPFTAEYYPRLFEAAGQRPRTVAHCNSAEMVRSLVGAGRACAILNMLPLTDTSYAGDRLAAVPISDPLPALTLAVGHRKGPQRRAVDAFVAACVSHFRAPGPLTCPPAAGNRGAGRR